MPTLRGEVLWRRLRNPTPTPGLSPGVQDDPVASFIRAPSAQQLSPQLRGRGQRLLGVGVDLFADLMHLQHLGVDSPDRLRFGQPAPPPGGIWFRLGVDYRY